MHDHIVQRGGSERVLLRMLRVFPGAPVYTSFYWPEETFPEFADVDVRPMWVNRFGIVRRHHRATLPVMGTLYDRLSVEADVALCSASAWAQGAKVDGRKIVYWHALAQWLYAADEYLMTKGRLSRLAVGMLRNRLLRWDRDRALTADLHLVAGPTMQRRVQDAYGVEAQILTPPVGLVPEGPSEPLDIEPGFYLAAARLMPQKNVDVIVDAFAALPDRRLVIAGSGQESERLRARAGANVTFLGSVADPPLRWLYANARGVVAAGREPYGLVPAEAAGFGTGAVALATGGLRDTVQEGVTGTLFAAPDPGLLGDALRRYEEIDLDGAALAALAARHSERVFADGLRRAVEEGAP